MYTETLLWLWRDNLSCGCTADCIANCNFLPCVGGSQLLRKEQHGEVSGHSHSAQAAGVPHEQRNWHHGPSGRVWASESAFSLTWLFWLKYLHFLQVNLKRTYCNLLSSVRDVIAYICNYAERAGSSDFKLRALLSKISRSGQHHVLNFTEFLSYPLTVRRWWIGWREDSSSLLDAKGCIEHQYT